MNSALDTVKSVRDFWNRHATIFLPNWLRDQIVETEIVFEVTAIRDGKTKFGPTWFVDILVSGSVYTMPMSHNEVRDAQLLAINAGLGTEFATLPATLVSFESAFDNPGFSLAPPSPAFYADLGIPADTSGQIEMDLPDGDVPFQQSSVTAKKRQTH